MTDALRDSEAKRIAGWDSDYRTIPEPVLGPGLGSPGWGSPRAARGRGGEISGKFRGRPGAPRGAPGSPIFGPPGTPKMAPFWGPIYTIFVLQEPPFGGVLPGHFLGLRGGSPPGGQKSAHFFGYLITLPVGTVWALFSDPPLGHSWGQKRGLQIG